MRKFLALLLIPILIAVFFLFKPEQKTAAPEIHGIYLSKPQYLMPFALTQTDGKPFTDQNLQGQWSLVFFGFTYCPDICPTTLAMLNAVMHELEEQHPELTKPQVVFVSVDPERDNLAQLDKYTHYFNPNFIGITGEASQLQSFSRQLGVVFDKVFTDPKHPDQYLMEHSTSIALINPQGGIQAIFTSPHQVDALTQDIVTVYELSK
jgi:protein SCO1/2